MGGLDCLGVVIVVICMCFGGGFEGVDWICVWVFFSDISLVGGEMDNDVIFGLIEGVLVIFVIKIRYYLNVIG